MEVPEDEDVWAGEGDIAIGVWVDCVMGTKLLVDDMIEAPAVPCAESGVGVMTRGSS